MMALLTQERMDLWMGLLPFVVGDADWVVEIRTEDGEVLWREPGRCPDPACACQGAAGISAPLRRLG
jgi:hypothetical protein